jgi:ABC-type glycerol-3-phosphate transport system permease component
MAVRGDCRTLHDGLPFKIPGVAVVSNVITVAFLALCAVKIGVGRNWARWAMLVFFVLGFLMLPLAVIIAPQVML